MHVCNRRLVLGLVGWLAIGGVLADPGDTPATLRYLIVDAKSRPFQLEPGEFPGGSGIVTDVISELVAALPGVSLESHTLPVLRLQHMVRNGQVDNWIVYDAKVWNTFEKEGRFLDVPLFEVTHSLATCRENLTVVSSVSALQGREVAILKGFDYPELEPLAAHGDLSLVPVDTYRPGFELVTRNRVSGFVEMDLRLKYNALTDHIQADCLRYVDISAVIPPFSIYLQVDSNMPEPMVQSLETRLRRMKDDGEIDRIVSQYQRKN